MMKGTRYPRSDLYMLNLTQRNMLMTEFTTPDEYFAGSVHECNSKGTLVDHHHKSCWSPTQSRWVKAITKNFFTSWPGLSSDPMQKYLTKKTNYTWAPSTTYERPTINTGKGTTVRTRTRTSSITRPIYPIHTVRRHKYFLPQDSGFNRKNYTDQTGRFPVTSSKGNKYILVAYHYDSNTIHAEPLKTRSGIDLNTAYHKLHSLLTNRGLKPSLHILDNECHNVLNTFMKEVNEKFQLVLPHTYRRNSAERAIRTFKQHFITGLDSTHKYFQIHIWC